VNELALFAGGGGGILGGLLLGWRTVCAVEIDPYCRSILLARQRDGILEPFPIWDDVRTFDGKPWKGSVDVVSGGFPCTDISAAGKGAGIDGAQSGLWSEMARIVGEVQPRHVFVENSPMLTSRGLGRVLGDLSALGYDARWGVVGAVDVGAAHKRDRLWLCADMQNSLHARTEQRGKGECDLQEQFRRVSWRAETMAEIERGDDGVADRLDERNGACGNGQVPAVAALAWRLLMDTNT